MHMSIIYGTTDNNKAKEMDQELGQGDPLNELIDIDEESLTSLIPEADYIIDNIPNEDEDVDNTIKNLGINNLLDFLGEYFDKKYFDLRIKNYHAEAIQKPNAAAEYEKEYEAALNKIIEISHDAGMPLTNKNFYFELTNKKFDELGKKYGRNNLRELVASLPKYFDDRTEYNPALILFPNNERVSDMASKVKLDPVTYYIYPQVIGDFHC